MLRHPNPHVGFGAPGPHFCLGAHLARREITVMFRELFRHLPDIRATAEPDRLRSNFINGIKHLPCAYLAASAITPEVGTSAPRVSAWRQEHRAAPGTLAR